MDMDWTTLAAQRAEYVSDRVRGLMSSALRFLRVELGLDLGLKPEQCPSWMILSTALVGLLLLLAVFGACGRRKRRVLPGSVKPVKPSPVIVTPAKTPKTPKPEPSEPKKKNNKKKATDKQKAQVNGQAVAQPQEETKVSEERKKPAPAPEQPPVDAKTKKPKKKTKPEVKPSKDVSSTDGKEPDEAGAWETKISNKEKRQQRKKEKGPGDDSGSPQAGDHANQKVQPTAVSPTAVSKKKKEASRPKAGKPEPNVTPVTSNWNNGSAVNGGEWTEVTGKQSTQQNSSNSDKWSAGRKKNRDENNWKPDSHGSWTGLDGRVKSDPSPVNFTSLGLNTKADKTGIKPCVETRQYENAPVDSEWSNFNGLSTADPGSDWNAPTEAWGNYEEPKTDALVSKDTPVSVLQVEPNDDKDVADSAESGKSKRRRKKKKTEDDGSATEIIREDLGTKLLHPPQKEVLAKQNVPPPSSQKKPDQNWEAPKQVQKKKARRET